MSILESLEEFVHVVLNVVGGQFWVQDFRIFGVNVFEDDGRGLGLLSCQLGIVRVREDVLGDHERRRGVQ